MIQCISSFLHFKKKNNRHSIFHHAYTCQIYDCVLEIHVHRFSQLFYTLVFVLLYIPTHKFSNLPTSKIIYCQQVNQTFVDDVLWYD